MNPGLPAASGARSNRHVTKVYLSICLKLLLKHLRIFIFFSSYFGSCPLFYVLFCFTLFSGARVPTHFKFCWRYNMLQMYFKASFLGFFLVLFGHVLWLCFQATHLYKLRRMHMLVVSVILPRCVWCRFLLLLSWDAGICCCIWLMGLLLSQQGAV